VAEPNGIHLMLSPSHEEVADDYLSDLTEAVTKARGGAKTGGAADGEAPTRYA
jgi:hypothetical protein